MEKTTRVYFPRWAIKLYALMAIALIPWIIYLAATLPARQVARHWDTVWAGFDTMMLAAIVLTLWFMLKRKIWVVVSASALATVMIVDAWFDILTAKSGHEQEIAIFFGIIELALALLTFRLVFLMIHHATPERGFKLHIKDKA